MSFHQITKKNLINILKKTSKTQFENAKTQFENIKTQKTAQVVAWNSLDTRTKISPKVVLHKRRSFFEEQTKHGLPTKKQFKN